MTWANAGWCLARCVAGMAGMGWKMAIGFTCSGCRGRIKVICHRLFSLDQQIVISLVIYVWLVVWNMAWSWLSIYWEPYSHLTNIFQRGWNHEPDVIAWHHVLCIYIYIIYIYIDGYTTWQQEQSKGHRGVGVWWLLGRRLSNPSTRTVRRSNALMGYEYGQGVSHWARYVWVRRGGVNDLYIYITHIIIYNIYLYIYLCIHWKRCFHYYTDWGRN